MKKFKNENVRKEYNKTKNSKLWGEIRYGKYNR